MSTVANLRRRTPEPPAGPPEVEFRPGLANETLGELAPLLAEEGTCLPRCRRSRVPSEPNARAFRARARMSVAARSPAQRPGRKGDLLAESAGPSSASSGASSPSVSLASPGRNSTSGGPGRWFGVRRRRFATVDICSLRRRARPFTAAILAWSGDTGAPVRDLTSAVIR